MKLKPIASNLTELQIASDVEFAPRIAFSYQTPVAGFDEFGAFKTDKNFSPTTSKHIDTQTMQSAFASGVLCLSQSSHARTLFLQVSIWGSVCALPTHANLNQERTQHDLRKKM